MAALIHSEEPICHLPGAGMEDFIQLLAWDPPAVGLKQAFLQELLSYD
jgi:hypothetical protein